MGICNLAEDKYFIHKNGFNLAFCGVCIAIRIICSLPKNVRL